MPIASKLSSCPLSIIAPGLMTVFSQKLGPLAATLLMSLGPHVRRRSDDAFSPMTALGDDRVGYDRPFFSITAFGITLDTSAPLSDQVPVEDDGVLHQIMPYTVQPSAMELLPFLHVALRDFWRQVLRLA